MGRHTHTSHTHQKRCLPHDTVSYRLANVICCWFTENINKSHENICFPWNITIRSLQYSTHCDTIRYNILVGENLENLVDLSHFAKYSQQNINKLYRMYQIWHKCLPIYYLPNLCFEWNCQNFMFVLYSIL